MTRQEKEKLLDTFRDIVADFCCVHGIREDFAMDVRISQDDGWADAAIIDEE